MELVLSALVGEVNYAKKVPHGRLKYDTAFFQLLGFAGAKQNEG